LDTDVTPVGAVGEVDNPYHHFAGTFTAANESELLSSSQTAEGDNSVLLDNVSIFSLITGDMDRDNDVDFDDIQAFVLGLNDAAGYEAAFGIGGQVKGDTDGDGDLDFDDIPGFVALLGGQRRVA